MATYPTSLDALTNPASGSTLTGVDHALQHSNVNDIAEALEAKVGIGASTPVAATLLAGTGTGTSAWQSLSTIGIQPLDSDLTAIAAIAPANDDVIQRKAGAWTNRTLAQLIADLAALGTTFQPLDSDLTAIAALTTTTFGRSLLAAADASALRTLAGTVIGTDVQAFDSELAAIAGLVSAADRLPYFTGAGTAALATFTATARTLLDDTSIAAMLATLGLTAGTLGGIPAYKRQAANATCSSTTVWVDTDLTFAIAANEGYAITISGVYNTAATTTGLKLGFNAPSGCTLRLEFDQFTTTTAKTPGVIDTIQTGTFVRPSAANTARPFRISGFISNGANAGNITLQILSEVAASNAVLVAGTWMQYQRII